MSDIVWHDERRKLSELIPWPRNPRQINTDQGKRLAQSFDEFAQVETIAIGPGNEVYNGHQRLNVWASKFGDIEVDVRVASRALTEKEREKLTIFLHKGAAGEWDFDKLANEFEMDELLEWGFSELDLQMNMTSIAKGWDPEDKSSANPDGDGINEMVGYSLASLWYGMDRKTIPSSYMPDLPPRKDAHDGATVKINYSRTNPESCERIITTYLRSGDIFFEMCCGWMTFSSIAKYYGYSGKGGDIWGVSLEYCAKLIKKMPGDGIVEVIYADCRDTKEPDSTYDFIHSNPPFFSLEPYGEDNNDLASLGGYELWLQAMGQMGSEAERILKPGGLANFVINDYRKDGVLIPMHADFMRSILDNSNLVLHDLVVSEVISQALRFRQHDYERRRTVKCHEYVLTFKKRGSTVIQKESDA